MGWHAFQSRVILGLWGWPFHVRTFRPCIRTISPPWSTRTICIYISDGDCLRNSADQFFKTIARKKQSWYFGNLGEKKQSQSLSQSQSLPRQISSGFDILLAPVVFDMYVAGCSNCTNSAPCWRVRVTVCMFIMFMERCTAVRSGLLRQSVKWHYFTTANTIHQH